MELRLTHKNNLDAAVLAFSGLNNEQSPVANSSGDFSCFVDAFNDVACRFLTHS